MPSDVRTEAAVLATAAAIDGRAVDPSNDAGAVADVAIVHRVSALLARSEWGRAMPADATARVLEDARLAALHGATLDCDLPGVLAALADRGITAVVIKGAHLAHRVYPSPALRPRADTDLLVLPEQTAALADVLASSGFTRSVRISGSVILGQVEFERRLRGGVTHYLDVHWRAAAPLMFEQAFDTRALVASAEPIPALGPHARGPAARHALALACVHLAAHHWHQVLLVWLQDLRLLADALTDDDRQAFVEAAGAGRYTVLAHGALMTARTYFESAGLDRAIAALVPRVDVSEPGAVLIRDGRRPVDDLWFDLRQARWRQRAQLLREHVLPPAEYMRARFGGSLPLAYAKRLIFGVRKWF